MAGPLDTARLGRSGVRVTKIGLGGGPLASLFTEVTEEEAGAAIDRAWDLGIRFFDTAPLYGHGLSEVRFGAALRARPRGEFVIASKVGRLLVPLAPGERVDTAFANPLPFRPLFDFSRDAILRSVEESLERTGLDRIDVLHVHDADSHFGDVIRHAYPALDSLRAQGVAGAIGAGMNQWQMLARFARECDFDCFLLAGRYTLIDHSALPELLPLCVRRNISIILGGPYNSGILATGARPGALFNYEAAPAEWMDRTSRTEALCARHGVPLKAAALQFPLRHPAVAAVIPGCRSAAEVDESVAMMGWPIPDSFWRDYHEMR
jgi:D-threo-aldose 1-dehydrogenase